MTYLKNTFGNDLSLFEKAWVGFDQHFDRITQVHQQIAKAATSNFPPHNIKKIDENKYVIEMAVAGFAKSELEIELKDSSLIVKGNAETDNSSFVFQGIAARNFTKVFPVADTIEIKGANILNGILRIALENIIPEHKKPKKIEISDEPSTISEFTAGNKVLLLEEKDL